MTYKFSRLIEQIKQAAIPAWLAEHVFSNKTRIALTLQKSGQYSFKSPTGDIVTIRYEVDGNV
jgi:hypothetical protein